MVGIPQSSSTNVAAGGIGSIISHRHGGGEGIANCTSIIANGGEGGGGGGGGSSASSSERTTSGRKGGSSPRGTSGRNLMDILEDARERWLTVRRCTWHTRMLRDFDYRIRQWCGRRGGWAFTALFSALSFVGFPSFAVIAILLVCSPPPTRLTRFDSASPALSLSLSLSFSLSLSLSLCLSLCLSISPPPPHSFHLSPSPITIVGYRSTKTNKNRKTAGRA